MTDQKKANVGKSEVIAAAVAGAVIGASAVVGAVALKDKKNRNKLMGVLTDAKDQAMGYLKELQKELQDNKDEVTEKLIEGKKEVKKVAASVKDSAQKALKDKDK